MRPVTVAPASITIKLTSETRIFGSVAATTGLMAELADRAHQARQDNVAKYLELGQALCQVAPFVPHGQWVSYLKTIRRSRKTLWAAWTAALRIGYEQGHTNLDDIERLRLEWLACPRGKANHTYARVPTASLSWNAIVVMIVDISASSKQRRTGGEEVKCFRAETFDDRQNVTSAPATPAKPEVEEEFDLERIAAEGRARDEARAAAERARRAKLTPEERFAEDLEFHLSRVRYENEAAREYNEILRTRGKTAAQQWANDEDHGFLIELDFVEDYEDEAPCPDYEGQSHPEWDLAAEEARFREGYLHDNDDHPSPDDDDDDDTSGFPGRAQHAACNTVKSDDLPGTTGSPRGQIERTSAPAGGRGEASSAPADRRPITGEQFTFDAAYREISLVHQECTLILRHTDCLTQADADRIAAAAAAFRTELSLVIASRRMRDESTT